MITIDPYERMHPEFAGPTPHVRWCECDPCFEARQAEMSPDGDGAECDARGPALVKVTPKDMADQRECQANDNVEAAR